MRLLGFALILLVATNAAAQQPPAATANATKGAVTIRYTEDTTDFPNPERGFYIPIGASAGRFKPLDAATLAPLFHTEHRQGKARYTIHSTLLLREYTLDTFKSQPLSSAFLDALDHDLQAVRQAGIKAILRFAYIDKTKTGDCPDLYHICPPYGDASKAVVLNHIAQLKPILRKNADVIAVLQEGFIGVWGENFYTDYFGDPGKNGPGRIMDSSWIDRNDVLNALLAALPADRMIQVRTPQIKQKAVYGPEAGVDAQPLVASQAYSASPIARIGFHNDCFLASPDDYGTYYDYGSTNTPQKEANTPLRRYLEQDSRYVPVGGETCDDAFSPQNDCSPAGHAEQEMAAMHYSFLNSGYNNEVNNDWDSLGCMSSIRRRLGYRFVLKTGHFPTRAAAGKPFSFTLDLENAGFAAPYNPRPVVLIFRNTTTGKEIAADTHADPRTWFSGPIHWTETLTLPADLPAGKYELLLSLPDPYASLASNPPYHIRLADKDAWEPTTGYNRLHVTVSVR
jgi:hypothetical protein